MHVLPDTFSFLKACFKFTITPESALEHTSGGCETIGQAVENVTFLQVCEEVLW